MYQSLWIFTYFSQTIEKAVQVLFFLPKCNYDIRILSAFEIDTNQWKIKKNKIFERFQK